MNANPLLFWMSHVGEGTWDSFAKAVKALTTPGEKDEVVLKGLIKKCRFAFSELACADFNWERRRWKAAPPAFASFVENPGRAVLCGGRTPRLLECIKEAAAQENCSFTKEERHCLPDHFVISGPEQALSKIAAKCHLFRSIDLAEDLIREFGSISAHVAAAPSGEVMKNWRREYFDLASKQWTRKPILRTACECISQYSRRVTLLQISKKRMVALPRRLAVYAAASIAGVPIISYDKQNRTLGIPGQAPLPEICARLLCLSSENTGVFENGMVTYTNVPERIANLILASLGQRT